MLTMLMRWLFGSMSLTYSPYSFPRVCSIVSCFLMYMAMPPRFPVFLRSSIMLYPSSIGGRAAGANHVSYTLITSNSHCASSIYSLR